MAPGESIYRPYARLVRLRVLDRWFEVPENNILLRCFQYLAPEVPYGPYCWNGDCENDRICFRLAGGSKQAGLACQTLIRPGLEIDEISPELARSLRSALEPAECTGAAAGAGQASETAEPLSKTTTAGS